MPEGPIGAGSCETCATCPSSFPGRSDRPQKIGGEIVREMEGISGDFPPDFLSACADHATSA